MVSEQVVSEQVMYHDCMTYMTAPLVMYTATHSTSSLVEQYTCNCGHLIMHSLPFGALYWALSSTSVSF